MTSDSQQTVPPGHWTTVITPHGSVFHLPWRELMEYKDLIMRFVHRDFVSRCKQIICGSLWYFLQPLFTNLMRKDLWLLGSSSMPTPPTTSNPAFCWHRPELIWQRVPENPNGKEPRVLALMHLTKSRQVNCAKTL